MKTDTNAGHTPGNPTWLHGDGGWRFATSPSSGHLPFKLLAGQCLIAEVLPCPTTGSGWSDEEVLMLIEAAPALLEALKDCVESLEHLPNLNGAYRQTCINQARAAIAQATR